jgi:hypothetical protein
VDVWRGRGGELFEARGFLEEVVTGGELEDALEELEGLRKKVSWLCLPMRREMLTFP